MLHKLRTTWQAHTAVQVSICGVLFLALWQAPLPWVHRHNAADEALSQHLRLLHSGQAPVQEDSASWHWHYALLWQLADCDQTPGSEDQSHPVLMLGNHSPCLISSAPSSALEDADVTPNLAEVLPAVECLAAGSFEGRDCLHFLESYSAAIPVRALLCVARC